MDDFPTPPAIPRSQQSAMKKLKEMKERPASVGVGDGGKINTRFHKLLNVERKNITEREDEAKIPAERKKKGDKRGWATSEMRAESSAATPHQQKKNPGLKITSDGF